MQVYRKILVTIDCSPVDDAIVKHVALLAIQNRAKVTLLHVVHAHTIDQRRGLHERAEICVGSHYEELRAQHIEVQKIIRDGEPCEQVLREIEDGNYDLVAMAVHGHTFAGDILFGSVSEGLKHKISIPLLLLKPKHS